MIIAFIRTVILYIFIITIMRLMGKRQIGELQPAELVVALIIADLAAVPMENVDVPLISGIIPIITLYALEELLSYLSLKSERARGIISGKPSILIDKGKIIESELRRLRFNLNDLLEQLRLNGFDRLDDVEYAILETNGKLSTFARADKKPLSPMVMGIEVGHEDIPITIIIDGRVIKSNIDLIGKNYDWLHSELQKNNIRDPKEVFFAYVTEDKSLKYQLKEKPKLGVIQ